VHLLVDSTGLKLCGAGEWLAEKHGTMRRRSWRTLHLATEADTGQIAAAVLTDKAADDGSQVGPLLERSSLAMAPTTGTTSTPRSQRAIPMRPSSSHLAQARCQATPPRLRRRSGTRIDEVSPSAAE
jgi:Transposase DDE domain